MTAPYTTLRRPSAWLWPAELSSLKLPIDADYLIGLAIVALAPAVFWPIVVKAASILIGFTVTWLTLAILSAGIFAFLGTIYGLLARRR